MEDDPFQSFKDELKALAHSARDSGQDRDEQTCVSTDRQIRLDYLWASLLEFSLNEHVLPTHCFLTLFKEMGLFIKNSCL